MKPDHEPRTNVPPGARHLLAIALIAIMALTLLPDADNQSVAATTPLTCLACGTFGMVDVICNLFLFMPLGAALAWRDWRIGRVAVAALLLSFAIESTQYALLPGRDASLSDLLTNTTGAALGALLATRWQSLLRPSPTTARWFAVAAATGFLLITFGTSWLLTPSFTSRAWYGQVRPDLGHLPLLGGEVMRAIVADGRSLPGTRLPAELASEIRNRPILAADVGVAPAPPGLAPIAAIFDDVHDEQLLLGRNGNALVFRVRLRAADALLGWPSLRLPAAWPGSDESAHVEGELQRGSLRLRITIHGTVKEASMRLGPGWGWRLIMPSASFAPTEGQARMLSALWLLLVAFPLGWFASWGAEDAPIAAVSIASVSSVVVVALIGAPTWLGTPPADGLELASALGSAVVAALIVRALRHRAPQVSASL